MYDCLLKIDDLTRPDHSFIEPEDVCYYMGEYTARGGFAASNTNDLILNLKKPMDRKGSPEWKYKGHAIRTVADDVRKILGQQLIETATFVPIPPSVTKGDPAYDDRLVRVLARMSDGFDADVRELVLQRETMAASHGSDDRATIPELVANYQIDEAVAHPSRDYMVIFDDVLTTGRHYKAVQTVLSGRFPQVSFYGLFVARRVPKTDDVESLF